MLTRSLRRGLCPQTPHSRGHCAEANTPPSPHSSPKGAVLTVVVITATRFHPTFPWDVPLRGLLCPEGSNQRLPLCLPWQSQCSALGFHKHDFSPKTLSEEALLLVPKVSSPIQKVTQLPSGVRRALRARKQPLPKRPLNLAVCWGHQDPAQDHCGKLAIYTLSRPHSQD